MGHICDHRVAHSHTGWGSTVQYRIGARRGPAEAPASAAACHGMVHAPEYRTIGACVHEGGASPRAHATAPDTVIGGRQALLASVPSVVRRSGRPVGRDQMIQGPSVCCVVFLVDLIPLQCTTVHINSVEDSLALLL